MREKVSQNFTSREAPRFCLVRFAISSTVIGELQESCDSKHDVKGTNSVFSVLQQHEKNLQQLPEYHKH